ncbi:DUF4142 domain-containing protein [Xanthobacter sp. KR7-65]|uniref:DUF4142 domain-containing protein n=1 Tax=Xanthobacter sp. KR7-65 TaxID=3156612 RepID=UPI0032B34F45
MVGTIGAARALVALAAGLTLAAAAVVPPLSAQSATTSAPATAVPSTNAFIAAAATGDLFEIETSKLAMERVGDPATKTFARKLVQEHTASTDELKTLVRAATLEVSLPTTLEGEPARKLEQLRGLSGPAFATAYAQMQEEALKQTVTLFESYATSGELPVLKDWAGRSLPALRQNMRTADSLTR